MEEEEQKEQDNREEHEKRAVGFREKSGNSDKRGARRCKGRELKRNQPTNPRKDRAFNVTFNFTRAPTPPTPLPAASAASP